MPLRILLPLLAALIAPAVAQAAPPRELIANSDLETDANADGWPDDWPQGDGVTWETEAGNRFLRFKSPKAGATVMLYREIAVPDGVEGIEFTWRQRVTGLKRGKQPWFDARIMMEFLDGSRKKLAPGPKTPSTGRDTDGWESRSLVMAVTPGTKLLKFMPALLSVESGTLDLDDLRMRPAQPDAATLAEQKAERVKIEQRRQMQLRRQAELDRKNGVPDSIVSNGDFEADAKGDGHPDHWGRLTGALSWGEEDGNRFMRLTSPKPGELVMAYRPVDLPSGTQALEMTLRMRAIGLKRGEQPWFDGRFLMEFVDAAGEKLPGKPSPPSAQGDTNGWVEKRTAFLVPDGAARIILMPSLFHAAAGTLDIDDIVLRPTDPARLRDVAARNATAEALRDVPVEKPNRDAWPSPLKVVGNRLVDDDGREVILRGVNAGGLETLARDTQPIRSTVVAIDDWKANCVRVPIIDTFWFGTGEGQTDGGAAYRATVDRIVNLAANRGAYVILDLHRFRAARPQHAKFWTDAATHYKNHPAVLFDLLNEPHGVSWEQWRNGGTIGESDEPDESAFLSDDQKRANERFEAIGMQTLLDTVRATGARNVVVAGGVNWCNNLSGIAEGYALEDKDGRGVVYGWHVYNWHRGWEKKVLAVAAKHPVLVGEFGADIEKLDHIPAGNQEDPHTWTPDMLAFIQQHRLSWTAWCLHPSASPRLIVDWTYEPTPFFGVYVKQALAGQQFEMKRSPR